MTDVKIDAVSVNTTKAATTDPVEKKKQKKLNLMQKFKEHLLQKLTAKKPKKKLNKIS
ncbi:MAG: hypothetical protein ACLSA2_03135 [Candidatus Gastranaerophilaceae bacterium]